MKKVLSNYMKNLFYPLILLATCMLFACKDDVVDMMDENIPDDQKQSISFTLSERGSSKLTRASGAHAGFMAGTDIVARFESFRSTEVGGTPSTDLANKRTTRTVLQAKKQANGKDYSEVDYIIPDSIRYWDDAYGRYANISVYAVAVPGKPKTLENNGKTLEELVKYDKIGTETIGDKVSESNNRWRKNDNNAQSNRVDWTITYSGQSDSSIAAEDLCYSNNIQASGTNGRYVWNFNANPEGYSPEPNGGDNHSNGLMHLALKSNTDKTSTGHFDKGHLVFNHALTRLTINFKAGKGFEGKPFAFASGSNVKIMNVPVKGSLDIQNGKWIETETTVGTLPAANLGTVGKMQEFTAPATGYQHSLQAQFIPGYVFTSGDDTNVLQYTIDDNTYYLTQGIIFKALTKGKDGSGNEIDINEGEILQVNDKDAIVMGQGKNYVLNIVVNKTGIHDVTASLIDWVEINAGEIAPQNSYIKIDVMDNTNLACSNFALYRLDDPTSGIIDNDSNEPSNTKWYSKYEGPATLTAKDNNVWSTNWYWESNKSFYHFRTVNKTTAVVEGTGTGADKKDYFSVTSGQLVDDKNTSGFNDYHWGAPMYKDVTMKYDESKGFEDFIYPAIGSTTSTINIIEHHMMSNIHIVLHTPTETDDTNHTIVVAGNGVTLKDASGNTTTVELNRFYKNGTVEMGRGVVNPVTTESLTASEGINAPLTYFTSRDIEIGGTTYSAVTDVGETNRYSYRVVPQFLNRGTTPTNADKIGLTITTPDGNKYFVPELAVIIATTVGANNQHHTVDQPVTRWYPGYDYTYHINLKKTGIESITCSIVDWVKVETGSIDIGL